MSLENEAWSAIVFFGSDGSGKTTQSLILLAKLKREGLRAKRAWIRGGHSLAYVISRLLIKLGFAWTLQVPIRGEKVLDMRAFRGSKFWSLVEFISVVPLIISRMYLPLVMGYHVVAERYVVDTVVYNEYFIGSPFRRYSNILLRMIPKCSILIHLDVGKSDAMRRKHGDPLIEEFIDYQLQRYRALACRPGVLSINTSEKSVDEVSSIILKSCMP